MHCSSGTVHTLSGCVKDFQLRKKCTAIDISRTFGDFLKIGDRNDESTHLFGLLGSWKADKVRCLRTRSNFGSAAFKSVD
jgi:hypothetical protein